MENILKEKNPFKVTKINLKKKTLKFYGGTEGRERGEEGGRKEGRGEKVRETWTDRKTVPLIGQGNLASLSIR